MQIRIPLAAAMTVIVLLTTTGCAVTRGQEREHDDPDRVRITNGITTSPSVTDCFDGARDFGGPRGVKRGPEEALSARVNLKYAG